MSRAVLAACALLVLAAAAACSALSPEVGPLRDHDEGCPAGEANEYGGADAGADALADAACAAD